MDTAALSVEEVVLNLRKKIKPEADKILLRKVADDEAISTIILLPDQIKNKHSLNKGEVVAVGPGMLQDDGTCRAIKLSAGDIVLFPKHTGTEVKLDGVECYIITEYDVLARIKAGE